MSGFSGVFERHPRLTLAIVEFELAWAAHLLSAMDYTYPERHGEAIYRFKSLPSRRRGACPREGGDSMLPSDFFRRNVVLSFQEDAIGIRVLDVIGPDNMMWDNMMWDSDYPHSESTFPQSRKILAEILVVRTKQMAPAFIFRRPRESGGRRRGGGYPGCPLSRA